MPLLPIKGCLLKIGWLQESKPLYHKVVVFGKNHIELFGAYIWGLHPFIYCQGALNS